MAYVLFVYVLLLSSAEPGRIFRQKGSRFNAPFQIEDEYQVGWKNMQNLQALFRLSNVSKNM